MSVCHGWCFMGCELQGQNRLTPLSFSSDSEYFHRSITLLLLFREVGCPTPHVFSVKLSLSVGCLSPGSYWPLDFRKYGIPLTEPASRPLPPARWVCETAWWLSESLSAALPDCVELDVSVFQGHCFYHGEVWGMEGSSVAVSTCSGLRCVKQPTDCIHKRFSSLELVPTI